MNYEVIIIGGSYAGLSAALPLARARRKILIIDAGQRRNRFALHSHNFLAQDGRAAADIVEEAKNQLQQYATVDFVHAWVEDVQAITGGYQVYTKEQAYRAVKIIIATGVQDQLPDIDGLAQRWGQTVQHCPYCHAYELNLGKIGMLYSGAQSLHMALMLPDWGNTTLYLNGVIELDQLNDDIIEQLTARQVRIESRPILAITGHCDLVLVDGEQHALAGLFVSSYMRIGAPWIEKLGVEIEHNDAGQAIVTAANKSTNQPGIYACGDVTRFGGSVALAVADAALTGIMLHKSFIFNA